MIKDFFKSLGLDISFVIVGILSAVIMVNSEQHKAKTKREKFISIVSGFCFAVFVTPLIIWILLVSTGWMMPYKAQLGTCYLVGHFGQDIIKVIMRNDWKQTWEIVKSIKFPNSKK